MRGASRWSICTGSSEMVYPACKDAEAMNPINPCDRFRKHAYFGLTVLRVPPFPDLARAIGLNSAFEKTVDSSRGVVTLTGEGVA